MRTIFLTIVLISLFSCHHRPVLKTGLEGKPMPSFSLLLGDSTTYITTDQLSGSRPLVYLYFSPFCPYCRAQIKELTTNNKTVANIQFVFVTTASLTDMRSFSKQFGLSKYDNIIVGNDYNDFFGNYFKTSQVPYLAMFNKQGILKQVNLGKLYNHEIETIVSE